MLQILWDFARASFVACFPVAFCPCLFCGISSEYPTQHLSKLQHVFKFQDDLTSFNDHGYLESCINNIYPSEMIVNKTNVSVQKRIS